MYGAHGYLTGFSIGAGFGAVFIIALFIAALFLALAAKMLGIEKAGVLRALLGIVGGGVFSGIVMIAFGVLLPHGGWLVGSILAFLAYIWTIKVVFDTDWLRAFLALVLAVVIEVITIVILVWLLAILGVAALAFLS